jgi:hypothetical protein
MTFETISLSSIPHPVANWMLLYISVSETKILGVARTLLRKIDLRISWHSITADTEEKAYRLRKSIMQDSIELLTNYPFITDGNIGNQY